MAIAFVIVGLSLIITGAQNTYAQFGAQLQKDLTGPGNFTYWFAALIFVGILGYIPSLKTFSTWFMSLILLSLFLANKGFFANITKALQSGPVAPIIPDETNSTTGITSLITSLLPDLTGSASNLHGPGLTGNSNAQGANSTSSPLSLNNWASWFRSLSGATPNSSNAFIAGAN